MRRLLFMLLLARTLAFAQGTPQNPASSLIDVPGRVIVEPTYPSPLGEALTLTFVNAEGSSVAEIVLREGIKNSNFTFVRGGLRGVLSGDFLLRPGGAFLLLLPAGEHRLLVRHQAGPKAAAYYVKSVQAGSINLLEKRLTVKSPFVGEIVITLAKCAPETRAQCE